MYGTLLIWSNLTCVLYLVQSSSINNFGPPCYILGFFIALFIRGNQFSMGWIKLLCFEIAEQGARGMAVSHDTHFVFFMLDKVLQCNLTNKRSMIIIWLRLGRLRWVLYHGRVEGGEASVAILKLQLFKCFNIVSEILNLRLKVWMDIYDLIKDFSNGSVCCKYLKFDWAQDLVLTLYVQSTQWEYHHDRYQATEPIGRRMGLLPFLRPCVGGEKKNCITVFVYIINQESTGICSYWDHGHQTK